MSSVTCISFTLHSHGGSASFKVSCILALSILACMLFMLDLWRPSPANIIQKYVWVWDLARRGPFNIEAWVFTNMCSHILVQSLNSKSFANESANHPGQYFRTDVSIWHGWLCDPPLQCWEGTKKSDHPLIEPQHWRAATHEDPKYWLAVRKISSRLDRVTF